MFVRHTVIAVIALGIMTHSAAAQNRRQPGRSAIPAAGAAQASCVDVVSLRQGKPAKGLIISSQEDRLLMAVEREVLRRDNPELYRQAAQAERAQAEKAWTQLSERLQRSLRSPDPAGANAADPPALPTSPAMRGLLESELSRAQRELDWLAANPDELLTTQFLWLELSARDIQTVKRATPDALRMAVWGWSEGITDVTSRDPADLQRELAAEKINPQLQPPDLSHMLAPREQSDDEWAARLAIVRYALDTPLDFQGSNGVFVQTGDGSEAPELAALIQKMMSGNLEALLAELDPTAGRAAGSEQSDQWARSLAPRAEQLQRTEFRAVQLEPDPSGQTATVQTAFVAKLPTKGWHVVWSAKHTTAASEVSAEAQQQIAEDPQVKTALGLLSALGADAEAEVKKAVRFGAATMSAQKAAQSQFFQFRDRYIRRLDGPPL